MSLRLAPALFAPLLAASLLLGACDSCCPKRCDPCARPGALPSSPPPAPIPVVVPSAPAPPAAPAKAVVRWPDLDCGGGRTGRAILEELKTVASAKGWDEVVHEIAWWTVNCWEDTAPCCRHVQAALDAAKAGDREACKTAIGHPIH